MKTTIKVTREFDDGDVIVMRYVGSTEIGCYVRNGGRWKLTDNGGVSDNRWSDTQMNNFLDSGRAFAYLGNANNVL